MANIQIKYDFPGTLCPCDPGAHELAVGNQVRIKLRCKNDLWPDDFLADVVNVTRTPTGRLYCFQFDDAVLNGGPMIEGCDLLGVPEPYCCCERNEDAIADNAEAIAQNAADIDQNEDDIQANADQIVDNAAAANAAIQANTDLITANRVIIDDNVDRIEEVELDLADTELLDAPKVSNPPNISSGLGVVKIKGDESPFVLAPLTGSPYDPPALSSPSKIETDCVIWLRKNLHTVLAVDEPYVPGDPDSWPIALDSLGIDFLTGNVGDYQRGDTITLEYNNGYVVAWTYESPIGDPAPGAPVDPSNAVVLKEPSRHTRIFDWTDVEYAVVTDPSDANPSTSYTPLPEETTDGQVVIAEYGNGFIVAWTYDAGVLQAPVILERPAKEFRDQGNPLSQPGAVLEFINFDTDNGTAVVENIVLAGPPAGSPANSVPTLSDLGGVNWVTPTDNDTILQTSAESFDESSPTVPGDIGLPLTPTGAQANNNYVVEFANGYVVEYPVTTTGLDLANAIILERPAVTALAAAAGVSDINNPDGTPFATVLDGPTPAAQADPGFVPVSDGLGGVVWTFDTDSNVSKFTSTEDYDYTAPNFPAAILLPATDPNFEDGDMLLVKYNNDFVVSWDIDNNGTTATAVNPMVIKKPGAFATQVTVASLTGGGGVTTGSPLVFSSLVPAGYEPVQINVTSGASTWTNFRGGSAFFGRDLLDTDTVRVVAVFDIV